MTGLRQLVAGIVVDICANVGQLSSELWSFGYGRRLLSVEPLSDAHAGLAAKAKGDGEWTVVPQYGVGDYDGEVSINVSGNSALSSLRPMLELHKAEEGSSPSIRVEAVPIARLDSLAPRFIREQRRAFVRMDAGLRVAGA